MREVTPYVPVLTEGRGMFVTRGESEFEVSIGAVDSEWEGKIVEYNLSRVVPIVHLCHNWTSLDGALAGVQRRWQRLFPEELDEDRPDFQEALGESMSSCDVRGSLADTSARVGDRPHTPSTSER
jgi:hypothetical protein